MDKAYRMICAVDSRVRGTNFSAPDAQTATRIAEQMAVDMGVLLLTVKPMNSQEVAS